MLYLEERLGNTGEEEYRSRFTSEHPTGPKRRRGFKAVTWLSSSINCGYPAFDLEGLAYAFLKPRFRSFLSFTRSGHRVCDHRESVIMSTSPVKAVHDHAALLTSLEKAANEYPKPDGVTFTYGTAGFRTL